MPILDDDNGSFFAAGIRQAADVDRATATFMRFQAAFGNANRAEITIAAAMVLGLQLAQAGGSDPTHARAGVMVMIDTYTGMAIRDGYGPKVSRP